MSVRRSPRARVIPRIRVAFACVLAGTFAVAIVLATSTPTTAATASTVVSATVPTATDVDMLSCDQGMPGITDFGIVQPGASAVTTSDCVVEFGSSNATAQLRVRQSDGRGDAMWRPTDGAPATAYGGGDGTFRDGTLDVYHAGSGGSSGGIAAGPGGTILVAGRTGSDLTIRRYLATGAVDPSFGTAGSTTFSFCSAEVPGLFVLDDGSVVGGGRKGCAAEVFAFKLTPSGAPDPSFGGGDGLATGSGINFDVRDVAVDSAGGVIVVGGSAGSMEMSRFTPAGVLDATFGGDGNANPPFIAGQEDARGITIQTDGKIVVSGYSTAGDTDMWVARFSVTGVLDTATFGAGTGFRLIDDAIYNEGRSVAVTDDGSIYVAGYGSSSGWIAKTNSAGTIDTSFGTSGVLRLDHTGEDGFNAIVAQPGNKVIASGFADRTNAAAEDAWFVRVTSGGSLDTTFGTGGVLKIDIETTSNGVNESRWADDGDLLALGQAANGASVIRFDGSTVSDYSFNNQDWDQGTNTFGACLDAVGAGVTADWSVFAGCSNADGAGTNWRPIPTTVSLIAHATAANAVGRTVDLRFGFRAAGNQAPGSYVAPITFDVIAP